MNHNDTERSNRRTGTEGSDGNSSVSRRSVLKGLATTGVLGAGGTGLASAGTDSTMTGSEPAVGSSASSHTLNWVYSGQYAPPGFGGGDPGYNGVQFQYLGGEFTNEVNRTSYLTPPDSWTVGEVFGDTQVFAGFLENQSPEVITYPGGDTWVTSEDKEDVENDISLQLSRAKAINVEIHGLFSIDDLPHVHGEFNVAQKGRFGYYPTFQRGVFVAAVIPSGLFVRDFTFARRARAEPPSIADNPQTVDGIAFTGERGGIIRYDRDTGSLQKPVSLGSDDRLFVLDVTYGPFDEDDPTVYVLALQDGTMDRFIFEGPLSSFAQDDWSQFGQYGDGAVAAPLQYFDGVLYARQEGEFDVLEAVGDDSQEISVPPGTRLTHRDPDGNLYMILSDPAPDTPPNTNGVPYGIATDGKCVTQIGSAPPGTLVTEDIGPPEPVFGSLPIPSLVEQKRDRIENVREKAARTTDDADEIDVAAEEFVDDVEAGEFDGADANDCEALARLNAAEKVTEAAAEVTTGEENNVIRRAADNLWGAAWGKLTELIGGAVGGGIKRAVASMARGIGTIVRNIQDLFAGRAFVPQELAARIRQILTDSATQRKQVLENYANSNEGVIQDIYDSLGGEALNIGKDVGTALQQSLDRDSVLDELEEAYFEALFAGEGEFEIDPIQLPIPDSIDLGNIQGCFQVTDYVDLEPPWQQVVPEQVCVSIPTPTIPLPDELTVPSASFESAPGFPPGTAFDETLGEQVDYLRANLTNLDEQDNAIRSNVSQDAEESIRNVFGGLESIQQFFDDVGSELAQFNRYTGYVAAACVLAGLVLVSITGPFGVASGLGLVTVAGYLASIMGTLAFIMMVTDFVQFLVAGGSSVWITYSHHTTVSSLAQTDLGWYDNSA